VAPPPEQSGADLSTWVFLAVLAGMTLAVLAAYGRAISGWKPPEARVDLVSPEHFVRMRGVEAEIDLGRGWRATDDPNAAWHLWWLPASGTVIGLRTSALPPPPGPAYLGPVRGHSFLGQNGVQKFTGMKVLGHLEVRPARELCEQLRARPDGLDVLTGGTGRDAPPSPPSEIDV
jgi:hypothetical protein